MEGENVLLSDMKVEVTVGEFHRIHDVAEVAECEIKNSDLSKLSTTRLLEILRSLEAGQRLTDAETGVDAVYAHSYTDSIKAIEKVINGRK
jgi:hypothetical protein